MFCSDVGRFYAKASGRLPEIFKKLNDMVGFAPNEEIQYFEVF